MNNEHNVIVISKNDIIEVWGSITEICKAHSTFSYYTLRNNKFPFKYKGWQFRKIKYRQYYGD